MLGGEAGGGKHLNNLTIRFDWGTEWSQITQCFMVSVKTERLIKAVLVTESQSFLFSKKQQHKGRLTPAVMGRLCKLVSSKKRKKHADYSQTFLILTKLFLGSNDPKPIFHWSQPQCPFTVQSHQSPLSYQLNRLFRDLQNWTQKTRQKHPIAHFCPKFTLKNSEAEFKKLCMPTTHIVKMYYLSQVKFFNKTVLYFLLSLKDKAFK